MEQDPWLRVRGASVMLGAAFQELLPG
jgi:hypothetical protein